MAHTFLKVRRVGDPTVTAELAEISLPVWEGVWEPIPDDDPAPASIAATAGEAPAADATKPSRSSRSTAASIDKE